MEGIEILLIEKQKKHMYRLSLDNESECMIHEDLLVKYQLYKGKVLSEEEFRSLETEAAKQGILQAALRLIQFRTRTAKELRTKLLEKEFPEDAISELIEKLTKDGYINHKEYAMQFVRDAVQLKKKGLMWARYELAQRGIERALIEEAISSIDDDLEFTQMIAMSERKWDQYTRKYGENFETKLRMRHFLEQKGCTRSTINKLMSHLES